jgi:hypothetical protein
MSRPSRIPWRKSSDGFEGSPYSVYATEFVAWFANLAAMLIPALLSLVVVANVVAQASQNSPQAVSAPAPVEGPLNSGACMDSSRAVPQVLQAPVLRSTQIVRIDKVESTQTMLTGEVIGYLYTLQDGTTWLGQRAPDYMSAADARAINQVLASTHLPEQHVNSFPPQARYGVPTKLPQYFRVQIPPAAPEGLQIELVPCVAWPPGRELPDPSL